MIAKEKEEIYDEEISPLMAKILEICRENKLAMLASFDLGSKGDPGLTCTSALVGPEYDAPSVFNAVVDMLIEKPRLFSFAISSGDASWPAI